MYFLLKMWAFVLGDSVLGAFVLHSMGLGAIDYCQGVNA